MRHLPAQNIIVICVLLYAGEYGVAHLMSGWRFPVWAAALIWVLILLASRFVVRRLLRGLRGSHYYGMGLIGAASFITAVAQIIDTRTYPDLGWGIVFRFLSSFLLLLVTAPWFVRKEQFSTL
jgi:hypothetical protein